MNWQKIKCKLGRHGLFAWGKVKGCISHINCGYCGLDIKAGKIPRVRQPPLWRLREIRYCKNCFGGTMQTLIYPSSPSSPRDGWQCRPCQKMIWR